MRLIMVTLVRSNITIGEEPSRIRAATTTSSMGRLVVGIR